LVSPAVTAEPDRCMVFDHPERVTHVSHWIVEQEKSDLDGSSNVAIHISSLRADDPFPCLVIQCAGRATGVYLETTRRPATASRLTSLEYRLDKKPWSSRQFTSGSDGLALGLWSGQSPAAFARELLSHNSLEVRLKEKRGDAGFDIAGIDEAIQPVRSACHW
jgi:type VI secretion system protein VasI